jgi:two-component system phosphate regulon sensor histidine kinase PhoR
VESGETRFDTEPVPPIELLHDAEESFREIARSQEVDLKIVDLQNGNGSLESLPAVRADREAIHQVFSNLIDNAMKYGRTGGRILLGARPAKRGIEFGVEFYVQDFGAGIASEHLPRLFERFYRVDKARSRESGGTGLGLAIAKHIMLAHGGSIRAESDLGHGTTFLFTLPTA